MAETARLLVLYHSSYGHTETLAYAVAHGARAVDALFRDRECDIVGPVRKPGDDRLDLGAGEAHGIRLVFE